LIRKTLESAEIVRDGSDERAGSAPAEEARSTKIANTLAGVSDRHPKLQVLIVHMGVNSRRSLVASNSLGTSTTMGFATRRSEKPYKNKLPPSETSRSANENYII
jgi:hypothetical protein